MKSIGLPLESRGQVAGLDQSGGFRAHAALCGLRCREATLRRAQHRDRRQRTDRHDSRRRARELRGHDLQWENLRPDLSWRTGYARLRVAGCDAVQELHHIQNAYRSRPRRRFAYSSSCCRASGRAIPCRSTCGRTPRAPDPPIPADDSASLSLSPWPATAASSRHKARRETHGRRRRVRAETTPRRVPRSRSCRVSAISFTTFSKSTRQMLGIQQFQIGGIDARLEAAAHEGS